jgi:hypothetical protein
LVWLVSNGSASVTGQTGVKSREYRGYNVAR